MLRGFVESGRREAAGFLSLDWVQAQIEEKTGLSVYPGTLNLRLKDEASRAAWVRIQAAGGADLQPPPGFCAASCFPVLVNGAVEAAIVLPHVDGYPPDVVEVIAAEGLRSRFGLRDGDECVLVTSNR